MRKHCLRQIKDGPCFGRPTSGIGRLLFRSEKILFVVGTDKSQIPNPTKLEVRVVVRFDTCLVTIFAARVCETTFFFKKFFSRNDFFCCNRPLNNLRCITGKI